MYTVLYTRWQYSSNSNEVVEQYDHYWTGNDHEKQFSSPFYKIIIQRAHIHIYTRNFPELNFAVAERLISIVIELHGDSSAAGLAKISSAEVLRYKSRARRPHGRTPACRESRSRNSFNGRVFATSFFLRSQIGSRRALFIRGRGGSEMTGGRRGHAWFNL